MVRTAKLLEPSSVRRLTPVSRMPAARRFIGVAKPYAQASVENNKLRGERALRVTPWYTKKYRVPYSSASPDSRDRPRARHMATNNTSQTIAILNLRNLYCIV